MTLHQTEDWEHIRKEKAREAISLAMESRWEEAVQMNHALLTHFPDDVDAYNRLGKALSELGRYAEAREAFSSALRLHPRNAIARKNLERLTRLGDQATTPKSEGKLTPELFIAESGKTGLTSLRDLAPPESLARVAAGDPVHLRREGSSLQVHSSHGEYLGQVEPRLAARLIRLMQGGNEYVAVLTSVAETSMVVLIREEHQDPSQTGILSFPRRSDGFPGPARDVPLPYDLDDEEERNTVGPPTPAWTEEDEEEDEEQDVARPPAPAWTEDEQDTIKGGLAAGLEGEEEEDLNV